MKNMNKVSNVELKNSLLISLQYNSDALDDVSRNELSVLKYIEFTLEYVEDCYNKSLKQVGGR